MATCPIDNSTPSCGTGNTYEATLVTNPTGSSTGQTIPVNTGMTVSDMLDALAGHIETTHLADVLRQRINIITDIENGFNRFKSESIADNLYLANELISVKNALSGATAYINSQLSIEADERNALVESVNTIVAYIDPRLSAAIEDVRSVRADLDGTLEAESFVKIDLAGNVYGYGLAATRDPLGNSVGDFRVTSDTFSIAPPTYSSPFPPPTNQLFDGKVWFNTASRTTFWWNAKTSSWQTTPVKAAQPFTYLATPTTISDGKGGSKTLPPGLYVNNVFAGYIEADQINTAGLTLKTADGRVLLGGGTSLDWADIDGDGKPDPNATRNPIYQTSDAPTGVMPNGAIWVDTTNGNNILNLRTNGVWVARRDKKVDQAFDIATTAKDTADGKIESFYQTWMPTTGTIGDLWFDTDDGNKLYRHNGSTFVKAQDNQIGVAILAASSAQSTADGKITTYFGDTEPTVKNYGDLWYSPSAKLLGRWQGGTGGVGGTGWYIVSNSYDNTANLIDGANLGKTADWASVTDINGVGKPENGATKNKVYRVPSPPTGASAGDIWFNTTARAVSYWNGSNWASAGDLTSQNQALSISGQGSFATLNKLSNSNINTYMESAAITTAYIQEASIKTLLIDGEAVSKVRHVSQYWGVSTGASGEVPFVGYTFYIPYGHTGASIVSNLVVHASTPLYPADGTVVSLVMNGYVDGSFQASSAITLGGYGVHMSNNFSVQGLGSGNHYIEFRLAQQAPYTGTKVVSGTMNLTMFGSLR